MKTIEIKVDSKIYGRLIEVLQQFDPKDLIVLEKDNEQQYLEEQLKELDSGKAEFLNLDGLEALLESRIKLYES